MAEDSPGEKPTHAERVGRKPIKHKLSEGKQDALKYLAWETANVSREAALRIEEVTQYVTEYALGKMSREEFEKRDFAYISRWGDALGGVADSRGMTNKEVYKAMEKMKESPRSWER